MTHHVMAFVAGAFGAALLILCGLSIATFLRFRTASRRLVFVEVNRPRRRERRR